MGRILIKMERRFGCEKVERRFSKVGGRVFFAMAESSGKRFAFLESVFFGSNFLYVFDME